MATQATITWTPGGGPNVVSQDVVYRKKGDVPWINGAMGLGPLIDNAIITASFDDNQLYEFKVIQICSVGGPQDSTLLEQIKFTCPTLTIEKTSTSLTVNFPHLGGSIDRYVIKMFDSTGASLIASTNKFPPFGINVEHTFSGLTPSTTYKLKVEVYAGNKKKLDCPVISETTEVTPLCKTATEIKVEMS